ncbi:MAG: FkbM family methyltransferase [Okeania sp. SIO2H7]|nr:FkbM family methyltransferase [Okeania sp. SIO2H7]
MNLKKITFPNKLECYYISSKEETEFIFREIFIEQQHLKNGIVIKEGDCIFDVGANIGLFPLFLNRFAQSLKIYSFEPIEPIFEVLQENMHLHSMENVLLFNYGLSSENNPEAVFSFYPNMAANSTIKPEEQLELPEVLQSSLNLNQKQLEYFTRSSQVAGELKTLSSVIKELEIQTIDLLKIDVEGAEYEVLQGIEEKDWSKIKQIIIEVHDRQGRVEQMKKMLNGYGFDLTVEKNDLLPAEISKVLNAYNLYATRK